jgi:UDP-4-amino-4,6-dideoxy-N-acetyl-beta-L-altrosamine transaminase
MKIIPYGRQNITREDIEAVNRVLTADFITQGPQGREFEKLFSEYIGSRYAVSVNNGTSALDLCVKVLGTKPGDKFITSPITFVASANCARFNGGEVFFSDIDPETYLLDLNRLEGLLKKSKPGEYKAVIPVDFAGYPVNMEDLRSLADKYQFNIIEDACHAPGGSFLDSQKEKQNCGNGQYADLAIFSFHPVKHIATGEGGMITTNNESFYKKLLQLRSHGITKDPALLNENHGDWYYEMQELSQNYRLTDFQSALGISQLKRADQGIKRRNEIAQIYDESLNDISEITLPVISKNINHAYHLYVIEVADRKELFDHLKSKGIYSQIHYIPVHLQPYYKELGWKKGDFPFAEKYYEHCISLPMFPSLSETEQEYVIEKIIQFFSK